MTHHQASSSRSAAPSTGRWIAVVVVVAGLFGMHGLPGHGSESMMRMGDSMLGMATTTRSAAIELEAPTRPSATQHAATVTDHGSAAPVGAMSGGMSGGAMSILCLAILTIAALLLFLAVRLTRMPLTRVQSPASFGVSGVGRDRGPPTLAALSIRRC